MRSCVSDFFSMLPRKLVPLAWQPLHQPAPPPWLPLWFMVIVPQVVVLLWQALQSIAAPLSSWVASGMWLVGLASAPVVPSPV